MGSILGAVRSFVVHAVAVLAIVLTYALSGAATQILSVAGLSSVALTTTASPASAQRWRRRRCHRHCRHGWYSRRRCWVRCW
jgi:hypothetical protein